MAHDKSWMSLSVNDRVSDAYTKGIQDFLTFAFNRLGEGTQVIKCPCVKCCNSSEHTRNVVETHLIVYGILEGYTFWYHHGEMPNECESGDEIEGEFLNVDDVYDDSLSNDETDEMIRDFFPSFHGLKDQGVGLGSLPNVNFEEEPHEDAKKFYRLLQDFQEPAYPGSNCSKLSAMVKLLHIKSLGRWSNESFTMLLEYLKNDLLPSGSTFPVSYYEAKKIIKDLGLSYKKIDACKNDCMLFRNEDAGLDACKLCHASRWRDDKHSGEEKKRANGKKIPVKVLRHFPLKPRLQRRFMSSKTASDMRWHDEERVKDGILRHPADAKAWKQFDELHQDYAKETRNVRLGLMSDGFQPFSNTSTPYSIWPVILVPYNVAPWDCMKQPNFILSMIIPGPEGPGDAIDVYLQPLIDELKELWEVGVDTYDASRRHNFILRAALLWTINDFPAYGILSGWSTKGKLACPVCHKHTHSLRLHHCSKQVYMRHRRFLPLTHSWRKKKDLFGNVEPDGPPIPLSGSDVVNQTRDLDGIPLTKAAHVKVKIDHEKRGDNWNKKSIFFQLPYWETNLLRHNLDVMHIERNVSDLILGIIMNMKGKTKDTIMSRLDMESFNIRPELHPKRKGDKVELPPAPYTLSVKQKRELCKFLKEVKVPDGFSSNISRCVNVKESKISGLKSHDHHILFQRLLPLVIRSGMPVKEVSESIMELSMFFNALCAKALKVEDLETLRAQMPITLSKLEKFFPPSCFNIMLHLPIHLAEEAIIGGPVTYRWMYSGERAIYTSKSQVRNRACPEGSMAESYIADECMTLCSRYLHGIETKFNRQERNYDGGVKHGKSLSIFSHPGRPIGATAVCHLDYRERDQAHMYALMNCPEVLPFYREHCRLMMTETKQMTEAEKNEHFVKWFEAKVEKLHEERTNAYGEELLSLARGPTPYVKSHKGYVINGYKFISQGRETGAKTQNSGVLVVGNAGDGEANIEYYGVLTDVLSFEYTGGNQVVFFRCKWWDVDQSKGVKEDKFGFVSVNCRRLLKTNEPFVLAAQALQVFYVNDVSRKGWRVAVKVQRRDSYQVPLEEDEEPKQAEDHFEAYQQNCSFTTPFAASTSFNDNLDP